jgi:transcriptional regulator with XRE-family HTH domain
MDVTPHVRLRSARQERGWTQLKLARHLSLTSTTISRWERGRARPRVRHLEQLAVLLGEPVAALCDPGPHGVTPDRVKVAAARIAQALDAIASRRLLPAGTPAAPAVALTFFTTIG